MTDAAPDDSTGREPKELTSVGSALVPKGTQRRTSAPRLHRLIVLLVAVFVCALRIGPAFTSAPDEPDRVFLGFPYSIEDSLQYADFIAQAKEEGRLFFSNRFTLDVEDPRLVIAPLYLIGRLAAWLGLSVASAWTLSQAVLIIAFVLVLYWFLGAFFPAPGQRLLALIFLVFAGGMDGWVVLVGDLWPDAWARVLKQNLWTVLGWTPYMSMYNPLYLAGWLVLLPWLRLLIKVLADHGSGWTLGLAAAALLPVLYLVHAYDAVVAVATAVLIPFQALLVRLSARGFLRASKAAGAALLGVVPMVALALWQAGDPLLSRVQAASHSGLFVSPVMWLVGFGGVLAAVFYGLGRMREDGPRSAVLFGWLGATTALSFSPLYEGRHFLYFVSLPLGIVAVDGLVWLGQRVAMSTKARVAVAVVACLVFGNSFVRTTVRAFTHPGRDDRMYITRGELSLSQALRRLPPGGVLASRWTGNWLPHLSGKRTVMGHWFLTYDMERKIRLFHELLSPQTSPAQRDQLLVQLGARYLFWGPREAALGPRPRTERVGLLPLQTSAGAFLLEIQLPR